MVEALAALAGCSHLLYGVAVAAADGLDVSSLGLALNISTGQVGGVIVDYLRHAGAGVAVIGRGLITGVSLRSVGEEAKRGQFGIELVIGLSLNMVKLASEKD